MVLLVVDSFGAHRGLWDERMSRRVSIQPLTRWTVINRFFFEALLMRVYL